jgi:hypothetical protein
VSDDGSSALALFNADQCCESCDVCLSFPRQRPTGCQVFLVPLRAGVVGREKAFQSEPVEQFAKVSCARRDVVVSVKGIEVELVTNTQFDSGLGHDLHQPQRSLGRRSLCVPAALNPHHGPDPTRWNRKPMGGFGYEWCVCNDRSDV